MTTNVRFWLCAIFVLVGFLSAAAAQEPFYKGKTIRIIVGGSAGGAYDAYTRVISRHMGKHIFGGTNWMAGLLWLEHFGLDLRRDNIMLQSTGDQIVRSQALESGIVDAAVIDMGFSKRLEQRGFNVLGDSFKTDIPFTGVDIVTTRAYIAEQPGTLENLLKALLESLAYVVAPKNQATVIELIMKRLRISDAATAESGYQDLIKTMARKPYPMLDGLRNVQRLLKAQNPRIADVNVEELLDTLILRKLD